jgi:hypothetical protein
MVYLLIPFTFNLLLLILKILINFFTKQATLMRRSTVVNLPLQHRFITEDLFTRELNTITIGKRHKQEITRNAKSNVGFGYRFKESFY